MAATWFVDDQLKEFITSRISRYRQKAVPNLTWDFFFFFLTKGILEKGELECKVLLMHHFLGAAPQWSTHWAALGPSPLLC